MSWRNEIGAEESGSRTTQTAWAPTGLKSAAPPGAIPFLDGFDRLQLTTEERDLTLAIPTVVAYRPTARTLAF